MKTEFLVAVQDTHIFTKEQGVIKLLNDNKRTMIYGIGVTVEQVEPYLFKVTTRSHFPKYAVLDRNSVGVYLSKMYGEVIEVTTYGLISQRGNWVTEPYIIKDGLLQPESEWSKLQSFNLSEIFGLTEKGVYQVGE